MKRVLWWITVVPCTALAFVLTIVEGLANLAIEGLHWWEGWCMEYAKHGKCYIGSGIWVSRERLDRHRRR